jgi:hypothetical protein
VVGLERLIPGLERALVERVVERLTELEPEATALLLTGSYAKGTAGLASDLDLTAISPTPRVGYRTWFEERGGDALLHVSVGATTAQAWLEREEAPARWSLGFPAVNDAQYLWSDEATKALLGADPSLVHPAAGPELEDFLEFALKARRSASMGDELGLRWFGHGAGSLAPALLIPLNDERIVRDRRDALDAALSVAFAPATYRADLEVCLGLSPVTTDVKAAVSRLGRDLLAFLREHAPWVDPQPEVSRYLADGTLERHLDQTE